MEDLQVRRMNMKPFFFFFFFYFLFFYFLFYFLFYFRFHFRFHFQSRRAGTMRYRFAERCDMNVERRL